MLLPFFGLINHWILCCSDIYAYQLANVGFVLLNIYIRQFPLFR